ncbi:hypothetical protein CLAFUR4_01829 [Fulvia fulva]|nr:hypothetical protein CLAFUR4_01829 [Fulvia fulva]KAK4636906.1 hypothetical protein CLAFUR0_01831 [Fulvia fulva]WPV24188.1 hypothetical protein CLAFUW7_01833 [Fulvia fulva]
MHNCPFHIATCQGCNGTIEDDRLEDEDDTQSNPSGLSSVPEDLFSRPRSMTPSSSVSSFHSPGATRMQLKEEFLKLYFPAGISGHDTDFMYSKFLAREALDGMGTTMNAAIDALSLAQLGTAHADKRLIREAQTQYQVAVANVNADLAQANAKQDDGLLGARYLLGVCQIHSPLSAFRSKELHLNEHLAALRELLLARGPNSQYSRLAQLLLYNFRHVSGIIGHAERKRVELAGPAWKRCSAITDGIMASLSEHLISVPGVLEKADRAMQRPHRELGELFAVLTELATMERNTQAWLLHWYSSFDAMPYWQNSVEYYTHFERSTKGAPAVFSKTLRFPSFSHASAHVTYWICLLQIKQTMLEINRLFGPPILPKSEDTLIAEATECADRLCESLAWITQPKYGWCGALRSVGPLHYAEKWYASQMDIQKTAWCQKVGASIQKTNNICVHHKGGQNLHDVGDELDRLLDADTEDKRYLPC